MTSRSVWQNNIEACGKKRAAENILLTQGKAQVSVVSPTNRNWAWLEVVGVAEYESDGAAGSKDQQHTGCVW